MAGFKNIEEGKVTKEGKGENDATVSSSKSGCCDVPIDPSVVSVVENMTERYREEDSLERKSPLCCRSCCDLLRACIICDIVFIALDILGILLFFMGITLNVAIDYEDIDTYDDDTYDDIIPANEAQEELDRNHTLLNVLITKNSLGIVFCTIGIVGAARFHKNLVLTTATWFVIDCIWSIVNRRWTGIVVTACFAYPHFALFSALKNGTITRETYAMERHCCCDSE